MTGHVLIFGVIGPCPDAGGPRALDLVSAEYTGADITIRTQFSVSSTVASVSGLTVENKAAAKPTRTASLSATALVPVVHDQKLVALPAQVVGQPVPTADHGLPNARSKPVTGTTPVRSIHSGPSTSLRSTSAPSGCGHNPASPWFHDAHDGAGSSDETSAGRAARPHQPRAKRLERTAGPRARPSCRTSPPGT